MSVALVYGVGVAGRATVDALVAAGETVAVTDDVVTTDVPGASARDAADPCLLDDVATLVPAPGVPETHRIISEARERGIDVVSEIEVAYRLEAQRTSGPRPMLAVTGTDGKTTTTMMATAILRAAGRDAVAAGNSGTPLCAAILGDADSFVVECSSFALARVVRFRARGAAWLNLSPDHLDWHVDLDSYEQAKANLWRAAEPSDVAVCGSRDPRILRHARASKARVVSAGVPEGDWVARDGSLCGPNGPVMSLSALPRALPHDVANAAVAAALAVESGLADTSAVAAGLAGFIHPPHRIALVAEHDGVRFFDDSKATTPHAALAAIGAFDSVVLIAGGRNKGLDLSPLAGMAGRLVAVVAIGDAAPDVEAALGHVAPTTRASSMREAVALAASRARPGDVVLLSPACASFDWYRDYGQRGDDFATEVRRFVAGGDGGDNR